MIAPPHAWIATGPIAIGQTRSSVAKILGPGSPCNAGHAAHFTRRCYTDGVSLVSVSYEDGTISAIVLSERASHGTPAATIPSHDKIASWKWNGASVFSASPPVPHPGWRPVRSDASTRAYVFDGIEVSKGHDKQLGSTLGILEE